MRCLLPFFALFLCLNGLVPTVAQKRESWPPADYTPYEKAPEVIRQVPPVYPEIAGDSLEGTVWVKVLVDETGMVAQAILQKSDNTVFNQPAIDAIKQWTFKPAMMNGKPVAVWVSIPTRFKHSDVRTPSSGLMKVQAQPASGVISGVITSGSSGLPIANATVTLTNTSFLAHTDTNGSYRFSNIPSGVYELRVSATGYMRMICYDLTVPKSIPVVVPIKLSPGSESGAVSTMRLLPQQVTDDRMLYYQPDNTINFKLRIVNPDKYRDSSGTRKK